MSVKSTNGQMSATYTARVLSLKIITQFISIAAAMAVLAFGSAAGWSQAADNTKTNKGQQGATPTADQGKNNKTDLQTMQQIRKAVVGDKSLSSYGHNVKIVSQNGKVTLKGPVRSEDEKKSIEQKAVDVAGSGNVTNKITIKPAK